MSLSSPAGNGHKSHSSGNGAGDAMTEALRFRDWPDLPDFLRHAADEAAEEGRNPYGAIRKHCRKTVRSLEKQIEESVSAERAPDPESFRTMSAADFVRRFMPDRFIEQATYTVGDDRVIRQTIKLPGCTIESEIGALPKGLYRVVIHERPGIDSQFVGHYVTTKGAKANLQRAANRMRNARDVIQRHCGDGGRAAK